METIENQLKQLILNNYDSISAFLKKIDMPRQTFESIMKRGIKKANIDNIFKICDELNITVDGISDGKIQYKNTSNETIAAHHDGDDFTKEELEEIERFKEFVKERRKMKNE